MICPFRVHTKTRKHTEEYPAGKYNVLVPASYKETTRTFEHCHGDECPFYYVDENDVPKCARCNGPEEEEIL